VSGFLKKMISKEALWHGIVKTEIALDMKTIDAIEAVEPIIPTPVDT
jgi:hypothetical protein